MTKHYHIEDAKTLPLLIDKMNQYEVSALGAFAIANGHFYQSFLGIPKVTPVVPETPLSNPQVTKVVKRKPRTKKP